jgi:hypothetical protein
MKPKAKKKKKPRCNCWRETTFCKNHEYLDKIYSKFIKKHKLKSISGSLDGTGRKVYKKWGSKWVYKFPLNSAGIRDNRFEAIAYRNKHLVTNDYNEPVGKYLAKCVLLNHDILRMEKLTSTYCYANKPELMRIDGGQGGYDKKRRYKLYDYSVNIKLNGKYRGVSFAKKGTQDVLYI